MFFLRKNRIRSLYEKRFYRDKAYLYKHTYENYFDMEECSWYQWHQIFGYIGDDADSCIGIFLSGKDDSLALEYAKKVRNGISIIQNQQINETIPYDYQARSQSRVLNTYMNLISDIPLSENFCDGISESIRDMKKYTSMVDGDDESIDFFESSIMDTALLYLLIKNSHLAIELIKKYHENMYYYKDASILLYEIASDHVHMGKNIEKQLNDIIINRALFRVDTKTSRYLRGPLSLVSMTLLKLLYVNRSVDSLRDISRDHIITGILDTA